MRREGFVDGEENEVGGEERGRGCGFLVLLFEGREENAKGCGEREREREGRGVYFRRERDEETREREREEKEEKKEEEKKWAGPRSGIFGCAAAQIIYAAARILNFSIFFVILLF